MICYVCNGKGFARSKVFFRTFGRRYDTVSFELKGDYDDVSAIVMMPCNECGGTGILHCCEGLREQSRDGDMTGAKGE